MRDLAEERGVHVPAAGQEQAVQAPREPIEGGGAELGGSVTGTPPACWMAWRYVEFT